jgi:DinB family protein
MHNASVSAIVFALFLIPSASAAQPTPTPTPTSQTLTLSGEMLHGYQNVQRDLAEAAEKMPDEHYGFRPTPDIKPFGQLVAHVALTQFRACAMLKAEPNPRKDEKEDASRTKADALALLEASAAYCDPLVSALTETTMTELTKVGQNHVAKGLFPVELVAHGMEMYGTMAVYLRLKGIVPPTTERQTQQTKKSR